MGDAEQEVPDLASPPPLPSYFTVVVADWAPSLVPCQIWDKSDKRPSGTFMGQIQKGRAARHTGWRNRCAARDPWCGIESFFVCAIEFREGNGPDGLDCGPQLNKVHPGTEIRIL